MCVSPRKRALDPLGEFEANAWKRFHSIRVRKKGHGGVQTKTNGRRSGPKATFDQASSTREQKHLTQPTQSDSKKDGQLYRSTVSILTLYADGKVASFLLLYTQPMATILHSTEKRDLSKQTALESMSLMTGVAGNLKKKYI